MARYSDETRRTIVRVGLWFVAMWIAGLVLAFGALFAIRAIFRLWH